jgi:hypothetical protein
MRRILHAALAALVLAGLIGWLWKPQGVEQRLLAVQVEALMPSYSGDLLGEALEVQASFVDFAAFGEPELAAKAWLALRRHPDMARVILPMYGDDPRFREVLLQHGEAVLPPIRYFLDHDIASLSLRKRAGDAIDALRWRWNGDAIPQAAAALTPEDRGRYAIEFIALEGHGFLGQFEVGADGRVSWIQTERALEGLANFFAGGIRGLETRVRRDEAVGLADLGWAALDVAIGISALKVLRMGRGATASTRVGFAQRNAALGSGVLRSSAIGLRVARFGAPLALGYIAVRHPSVLNALFGRLAETLGLPVLVVQVAGWTAVLFPLLWLLHWLLRPLGLLLTTIAGLAHAIDRRCRRPRPGELIA